VLVGTIFENTNKRLRDWFRVMHLMLTSKKGSNHPPAKPGAFRIAAPSKGADRNPKSKAPDTTVGGGMEICKDQLRTVQPNPSVILP
jgi:hypothetical protein